MATPGKGDYEWKARTGTSRDCKLKYFNYFFPILPRFFLLITQFYRYAGSQ